MKKEMKSILICLDRDGTLIYDKKYHLGHTNDWKSKIKILPGVINGIKLLNKIPNSKIYIVTNQPGIAINEFPLLTKKRENEVNCYLIKLLRKNNALIDGFIFSGFVNPSYLKSHPQFTFDKKFVKESKMTKPNPGMIFKIIKKEKMKNPKIYVLGDRATDAKAGLNAHGEGILIPFVNTPHEISKLSSNEKKKIHIKKNFLSASKYIFEKELEEY